MKIPELGQQIKDDLFAEYGCGKAWDFIKENPGRTRKELLRLFAEQQGDGCDLNDLFLFVALFNLFKNTYQIEELI